MKKSIIFSLIILDIIIIVSVIYNVLPRLQLNGAKNITISYRDTYQEPGVIVKNVTGNYMSKINIENNIENKIGLYYVDYSLKIGRRTLHVKRNVQVIDDVSPIIKLNGEQIIEMSINTKYIEPGFKAEDEYDGNITEKVIISGEVDTSKYGEYILTYEVKDNSNNSTKVNRIVKVIDEENPKFICENNYSVFKVGEKPIGCKAIDNYDGDITNKIEIIGDYDNTKPGIYHITYTVQDNAENQNSINHNIVIYDDATKKIFLTFDDGPSNLTPDFLKILKEENIKATFFIALQAKEENYKYLNNILDEGHTIGLHGYHNGEELYKDTKTFISYFEQFQNLIKQKINKEITIYRFPGGSKSKYLDEKVFKEIKKYFNENNIVYYDWNIDSTDSTSLDITEEEIIENTINQVLKNEKNEIIILFHDTNTKQATLEAMPEIINILKQMNCQFDEITKAKAIQFR